jgi:disulfide bond formation protein DsbB
MRITSERWAAVLAAAACALVLGAALAVERFGGIAPCAMCLLERWPYRIAIALGLLALLLPRRPARATLGLLALVMLGGAAFAAVHVGVEQKLIPDPLPECAAPSFTSGLSIAQRLAAMPAHPAKPCGDPTFLIPGVPLSMSALDAIFEAGLCVAIAAYLWRSAKLWRRGKLWRSGKTRRTA